MQTYLYYSFPLCGMACVYILRRQYGDKSRNNGLEFYQHVAHGKRQPVYVLFDGVYLGVSQKMQKISLRFDCAVVFGNALRRSVKLHFQRDAKL